MNSSGKKGMPWARWRRALSVEGPPGAIGTEDPIKIADQAHLKVRSSRCHVWPDFDGCRGEIGRGALYLATSQTRLLKDRVTALFFFEWFSTEVAIAQSVSYLTLLTTFISSSLFLTSSSNRSSKWSQMRLSLFFSTPSWVSWLVSGGSVEVRLWSGMR